MRPWRLSVARHARAFDGGYGLLFDGRWNTAGRPVTSCATSPVLCVLEKLVHVEAPLLRVPSAIVPIEGSPDLNVLINRRHPGAERIKIAAIEPFALDPRLS
ncbi:RES family NAD+ phosphorylase [Rhodopseudomonas parapalustris]